MPNSGLRAMNLGKKATTTVIERLPQHEDQLKNEDYLKNEDDWTEKMSKKH